MVLGNLTSHLFLNVLEKLLPFWRSKYQGFQNMVNETQISKMCPVTLKIRAARLKVGHNFRNLPVRNFFNKSCDYLCKIDINERSSIEFMTDRSVNDD